MLFLEFFLNLMLLFGWPTTNFGGVYLDGEVAQAGHTVHGHTPTGPTDHTGQTHEHHGQHGHSIGFGGGGDHFH